jgi:hypothetical protein
MNTMPIDDELVTDVLEELWAVVEHLYIYGYKLLKSTSLGGEKNSYSFL